MRCSVPGPRRRPDAKSYPLLSASSARTTPEIWKSAVLSTTQGAQSRRTLNRVASLLKRLPQRRRGRLGEASRSWQRSTTSKQRHSRR
jgi:hypothetical protein